MSASAPSPSTPSGEPMEQSVLGGGAGNLQVDPDVIKFLETPDLPILGAKKLTPRQRWNIDMSEPLITTAKCYIFKFNIPQWGKLYLFEKNICFRTLLSAGPMKHSIKRSWSDVERVESEDGMVLNSMRIIYKYGTKTYLAFEQPEERVRILTAAEKLLRRAKLGSTGSFDVLSPISETEDLEDESDPLKVADTASVNVSLNLTTLRRPGAEGTLRILKGGKPKHITIFTIGSRGDVQPFISLSKTLMKRGYKVRIATFAEYKAWVEGHGIEFRTVAGDPTAIMSLCVDNGMFTMKFVKEGLQQLDWIKNLFETAYEATEGTDLILLTQSAMIGANLAEARAVPCMHVFTMPWSATKEFPHPFMVPEKDKGPSYNLSSWKLIENGMGAGLLLKINEFRKAHKLPPTWPQGPVDYTLIPTMYCFSELLVPKPSDWSPHTYNTGFWFLDNPDLSWTPPADLVEFLDRKDGKKIVYIGFGSIVVQDAEAMSRAIIAAVEQAGVRAIVAEGWSSRGKEKKEAGKPAAAPAPAKEQSDKAVVPTPSSTSSVDAAAPPLPPRRPNAVFPPDLSLGERVTSFLFDHNGLTNDEAYAGLYQILADYSSRVAGKGVDAPIAPSKFTEEQVAALRAGKPVLGQTIPARGSLGQAADFGTSKSKKDKKAKEPEAPIVWPDTIYKVKAIPHDWLFPQLDGVVHHGGAGSTAAGLRAGCPTIIKPFFGDQYFWGKAIERQGLGVSLAELDAEDLAAALVKITTDADMRARAQAVGEKLRAENGPEVAADAIEKELGWARDLVEDLLTRAQEKNRLRETRKAEMAELRKRRAEIAAERSSLEAKLKAQGKSKSEIDAEVKETLLKSVTMDLDSDDENQDDDDEDEMLQAMAEISIAPPGGVMTRMAKKTGQGLIKATVLGAGLVTTGQVFGLQLAKNAWDFVVGGGKKKADKEKAAADKAAEKAT
ncbi:hypothetical protein DFJ74DRAFT_697632 [Hyaloraphidium curvatum]|nr:hypothetical protein DFJ74DRAFT_697632 [Hyaloraphidium curvatum]